MTKPISFTLDGRTVEAAPGETIWQVAKREGVAIPHLCHKEAPGYRPDGNCRACMVEIDGERTLAASCIRKPSDGMVVKTASERAAKAREMVFELLMADMPPRDGAPDPDADFFQWADRLGIAGSRFAARYNGASSDGHGAHTLSREDRHDASHVAIAVNLDGLPRCRSSSGVRPVRPDGRLDLRRLRRMRPGLPDRGAL